MAPYGLANGECVLNTNSGSQNAQDTSAASAVANDSSPMASACDSNQV